MSIINSFPTTIANGQVEDATVVMSLFAWIQSQTNGNACPATTGSAVLRGNGAGGTISATPGTDYSAGTQALATGILKSTTGTGALTVAVAGDFPTLNQNTTGNAATATNATNATTSAVCTGNSATATGAFGQTFYSFASSGESQIGALLAGYNSVYAYNNAIAWGFGSASGGSVITYTRSTGQITVLGDAGIGQAQSWQNFTGSRTLGGGPYTNNTGKSIQISVNALANGVGGVLSMVIGGNTIGVQGTTSLASGACYANFTHVIPNGATYQVVNTSGMVLQSWWELR